MTLFLIPKILFESATERFAISGAETAINIETTTNITIPSASEKPNE